MINETRITSPSLSRRSLGTVESGKIQQVPSDNNEQTQVNPTRPPYAIEKDLLLSWEFLLYWLVVIFAILTAIFAAFRLSWTVDDRRPGVPSLHSTLGLRKYFKGYSHDLSDPEWRAIYTICFPLLGASAVLALSGQLVAYFIPQWRCSFFIATGTIFVAYLHGTSALFIMAFAAVNFLVANAIAGKTPCVPSIWSLHTFSLIAIHLAMQQMAKREGLLNRLAFLPQGKLPWQMGLPVLVLRMMSYSLDFHRLWAGRGGVSSDLLVLGVPPEVKLEKAKQEQPVPASCYDFGTYVAYILYPPLFIAGPICSFKSFASQLRVPKQLNLLKLIWYGGGTLLAILALEVFSRLWYLHAIARSGIWKHMERVTGLPMEASELLSMGLFSLLFTALKWTVIWRVSRFFALLDGIIPPENVKGFIFCTASPRMFFRKWNASLYQWLVRYLYVPLGGRDQRLSNTSIAILFVATLWGPSKTSLVWASLLCSAFAFEGVWSRLRSYGLEQVLSMKVYLWRHLSAMAAAINLMLLFFSVLELTAIGMDIKTFLFFLLSDPKGLGMAAISFFAAAHIFNEVTLRQRTSEATGTELHTAAYAI